MEWTIESVTAACALCTLIVAIPFDVFATLAAIQLHRLVKELRRSNNQ